MAGLPRPASLSKVPELDLSPLVPRSRVVQAFSGPTCWSAAAELL